MKIMEYGDYALKCVFESRKAGYYWRVIAYSGKAKKKYFAKWVCRCDRALINVKVVTYRFCNDDEKVAKVDEAINDKLVQGGPLREFPIPAILEAAIIEELDYE